MRHKETSQPKVNGGFGSIVAEQEIQNREEQIAKAAYFIAQSRGFTGDHALDDWLQAEAEINGEHPAMDSHHVRL